jgi:hypothetical protein
MLDFAPDLCDGPIGVAPDIRDGLLGVAAAAPERALATSLEAIERTDALGAVRERLDRIQNRVSGLERGADLDVQHSLGLLAGGLDPGARGVRAT